MSTTFNIKKCKRREAKKRKLEAFLELVRKDEETSRLQNKKAGGTFEENYKALRNELNKYKKREVTESSFYLVEDGLKARVNLPLSNTYPPCSAPLFVEDVYHLLLKSAIGNLSPFQLRWAKLEHPQNICGTVLYVIENLSLEDIIETHCKLSQDNGIFSNIVEIISTDKPFAAELSTLHLASDFYNYAKENYADLFPMNTTESKEAKMPQQNTGTISKLHLLLNPIQLAMEHFPLPKYVFEQSKSDNYVFSKFSYSPVTENSPMFALDCEMCLTTAHKNEVTRVALVDENLKTVYDTLVKPKRKIINYLTRFSGITEKMMIGVTTSLSDVHDYFRKYLPSDAILCGQSLNCDLHALEMIHPYIIDTSVIFNKHGIRKMKTSLKNLSAMYLKETIQESPSGHHPVEDCIATMKLVNLKLQNSVEFGDAVFSKTNPKEEKYSESSGSLTFSDFVKLNSNDEGLFSRLSKFSKKVCLIGNAASLKNYCIEDNDLLQIINEDISSVTKATYENSKKFDLTIGHLPITDGTSIIELNNNIKETYKNLSNKTLFMVVIAGIDKFKDTNFKRSLCMTVLKN